MHVLLLISVVTLVLLWNRTKGLENALAYSHVETDSLVTYINELNQRVYELPSELAPQNKALLNKIAKLDSTYNQMAARLKAMNKSYKDLEASLSMVIESSDTASITNITNQYYVVDSTNQDSFRVATFEKDDGLLRLKATVPSTLTDLAYEYSLSINKAHVDLFRGRRGTLNAVVTFDDPRIKLSSQTFSVRSKPTPLFVVSAGLNASLFLVDQTVKAAPGLGVSLGVPIWTVYK